MRLAVRSILFPYTTLFRSGAPGVGDAVVGGEAVEREGAAEAGDLAGGGVGHEAPVDILPIRWEEHTSELEPHSDLVCRVVLEGQVGVVVEVRCAGASVIRE